MISAGRKIIIVSGFPRCGSTMMMRMLAAGGMDHIGNKVSFEDDRCTFVGKNDYWLCEAEGKAVKVLDQHRQNLPIEFDYMVIWMKRNYEQQAKSQVKILKAWTTVPVKDRDWKKFAASYQHDEEKAFEKLKRRGIKHLIVNFEYVLENAMEQSFLIKEWLGLEFNIEKMAAVVKQRDPKCAEGLDQEKSYL